MIIARTDYDVDNDVTNKIAQFCDVEERAVIALKTTDLLYDVPLTLEDAGLGDYHRRAVEAGRRASPILTAGGA